MAQTGGPTPTPAPACIPLAPRGWGFQAVGRGFDSRLPLDCSLIPRISRWCLEAAQASPSASNLRTHCGAEHVEIDPEKVVWVRSRGRWWDGAGRHLDVDSGRAMVRSGVASGGQGGVEARRLDDFGHGVGLAQAANSARVDIESRGSKRMNWLLQCRARESTLLGRRGGPSV